MSAEREGQYVQMDVGFYVPASLTRDQVLNIIADALVQIEEPIAERLDDGSDVATESWGIGCTVKINGETVSES